MTSSRLSVARLVVTLIAAIGGLFLGGPIDARAHAPRAIRHVHSARGDSYDSPIRRLRSAPAAASFAALRVYDPTIQLSGRNIVVAVGSSAAEEAGDGAGYLYRGVAEDHPGYQDALNGTAVPRGGTASAAAHNLGDTDSPFTSWSTDEGVARNFAGSNGAVMRIPNADGRGYTLVRSPDSFDEGEVLVRGPVRGATVLP